MLAYWHGKTNLSIVVDRLEIADLQQLKEVPINHPEEILDNLNKHLKLVAGGPDTTASGRLIVWKNFAMDQENWLKPGGMIVIGLTDELYRLLENNFSPQDHIQNVGKFKIFLHINSAVSA